MKNILFILILSLLNTPVSRGQANTYQEEIRVNLPQGTEQISEQELKDIASEKFNKNHMNKVSGHLYRKDGILFSYYESSAGDIRFKRSLEYTQHILPGARKQLAKSDVMHYSKIVNVTGIRFLVMSYQTQGDEVIYLMSEYNSNNKDFIGLIEFKPEDQAKAEAFSQQVPEGVKI